MENGWCLWSVPVQGGPHNKPHDLKCKIKKSLIFFLFCHQHITTL